MYREKNTQATVDSRYHTIHCVLGKDTAHRPLTLHTSHFTTPNKNQQLTFLTYYFPTYRFDFEGFTDQK